MKQSIHHIDKNNRFRFTGNSEIDTINKGGSSTDVDYTHGDATFNSTSSFVENDQQAVEFKNSANLTIIAKVTPVDSTPASSLGIVSFGQTSANNWVGLRMRTTGLFDVQLNSGAATQWRVATDAAAFADNTEATVGVVINGTQAVLYVNGVAVAQSNENFTDLTKTLVDVAPDNFRIGCLNKNSGGNTNFYDGDIFVDIYDKAMTAEEIKEYRQAENARLRALPTRNFATPKRAVKEDFATTAVNFMMSVSNKDGTTFSKEEAVTLTNGTLTTDLMDLKGYKSVTLREGINRGILLDVTLRNNWSRTVRLVRV